MWEPTLIGQISVRENIVLDNRVGYNVLVKLAQKIYDGSRLGMLIQQMWLFGTMFSTYEWSHLLPCCLRSNNGMKLFLNVFGGFVISLC